MSYMWARRSPPILVQATQLHHNASTFHNDTCDTVVEVMAINGAEKIMESIPVAVK